MGAYSGEFPFRVLKGKCEEPASGSRRRRRTHSAYYLNNRDCHWQTGHASELTRKNFIYILCRFALWDGISMEVLIQFQPSLRHAVLRAAHQRTKRLVEANTYMCITVCRMMANTVCTCKVGFNRYIYCSLRISYIGQLFSNLNIG